MVTSKLILKLVSLYLFLLPFCAFSQQKISADYQNKPLTEIIPKLEVEYHIIFSYRQSLLHGQIVTTRFKNLNLDEALSKIFQNTNIDFEVINESYIVLKSLEENNSETDFTLCGNITDTRGEALAFSNIFIKKTGQGTSANEQGVFHWETIIHPSDSVEFSYVGYQKQIRLAAELTECPTIVLPNQTLSFSEVIVEEYITQGIEQSAELDHLILYPDQIDVVPGLTEADVLQVIQIIPGVQSVDESAAGLHIRGGTPDQNLILWDGIPIYNSGHFFGMFSAFNPFIVDHVKLYRGDFGAEYGGRIAGVIDISSKQRIPKKITGNAGVNLTHSDAAVVIPMLKNKAGFLLSARQSYTNLLKTPTFKSLSNQLFQRGKLGKQQPAADEDDLNLNLDFAFTDLNAKWWIQLSSKDEVAVSFFGIFDELIHSFENSEEEQVEVDNLKLDNLGVSANWKRQWHPKFVSESKISFTDFQNEYQFSFEESGEIQLDLGSSYVNELQDLTVQINNKWQPLPEVKLDFGYQFSDLLVNREFFRGGEEHEQFLNNNALHSAFFTIKSHLKKQLQLNLGLRYSYYLGLSKSFLEPRFSIHYVPHSNWQFKLSAGEYRQFISQIIELNDLGFNEQLWAMSDQEEQHPVTKSRHISVGFLFHQPTFQFGGEAYHKKLSGLASWSNVLLNDFLNGMLNEGNGNVLGFDLLLKKRCSFYQTWLSYSWSQVHYTFDELNLGKAFPAPHDRPHALTFMHLINYKNWQFSMAWKYATGKAFTAADGVLIEDDNYIPDYHIEALNEERLAAYHRLDASILYQFLNKNQALKGTVGLSFLNLYNRKNILSRKYDVGFHNQEEGEDPFLRVINGPSLKFTPNMMLRLKF